MNNEYALLVVTGASSLPSFYRWERSYEVGGWDALLPAAGERVGVLVCGANPADYGFMQG